MNIPIRNLYYLFCYAWARFPKGEMIDVGIDDCPDLPNLFARILINGMHRLIRRGLNQGYITNEDETRCPRGRINLDKTIKEQTFIRGTLVCQFDERRRDILENRILKATARDLARAKNINAKLGHELRVICRQLNDVADIELNLEVFRGISVHRNNSQYAFLLRVSYLVYKELLPSSSGSGSRFHDILKDEEKMSRVFEEFLRKFYYYEQNEYRVAREEMIWDALEISTSEYNMLPVMRTDITLRSNHTIVIVDAKYYANPFPVFYGKKKINSAHLYQLYAYLRHAKIEAPERRVAGAIVYASVGDPIFKQYQIDGLPVKILAVDLSVPWPQIRNTLLSVLDFAAETSISVVATSTGAQSVSM
jgi:5-methylcytosine-specific restriction enzyme subunit McrC